MDPIKTKLKYISHSLKSYLSYLNSIIYNKSISQEIVYIVENANWSIACDGNEITKSINKMLKMDIIKVSTKPYKFRNKIIHFGSQYMWIDWYKHLSKKNIYIVNFYHGKPEDGEDIKKHIDEFLKSVEYIHLIVTASTLVRTRLVSWGVPESKLILIPIGVDHKIFKPINHEKKLIIKKDLGFNNNTFLIGSFQKDGVGWGNGLMPKLIKGPDIFVKVLKILSKKVDISVLLTGPARGYVISKLKNYDIRYSHYYLSSQEEMARFYQALDLYLVTSREEGGPKGILESLSSGISVASTDVGMARDLIIDGETGILFKNFDENEIANKILKFIESNKKFNKNKMREKVKSADWIEVGKKHWNILYKHWKNK